jgi:phage tail-like protein
VAAPQLLRSFRFRIKLRKSAGGAQGGVGAGASASASVGASASIGASASFSAGASAGAGFGAGASAGGGVAAGAGLGASAGAAASFGASASLSASVGFEAAVGVGISAGDLLGDGGFQECTGLEVEMDVQEYPEGGRNAAVVRRVGRAKYQNIVLKRGMFHTGANVNRDLWVWLQDTVAGVRPVRRYDGLIEVMSTGETVVARWEFDRGLPARIKGPELNAATGEIALEELHIAHEGLRLVS